MSGNFHGFDEDMFSDLQKVKFHAFKNGDHRFRILPPFAKGQLYLQVDLHWGFTDENNQRKVLTCTKYSHKTCAICDEADKMTEEIKMMEKSPEGYTSKEEFDLAIGEKKKRRDDIKRKSTYLWNILVDGAPKVLQLSWNGHEPLINKVKFLWDEMKINVTDPKASQLMYCQRTGQSAQTRYTYELIQNSLLPYDNIKSVVDLSKVYTLNTPAELQKVIKYGYVSNSTEDPNDRNFMADAPMLDGQATAGQQQTTAPVNQPAANVTPAPQQDQGVQQSQVQTNAVATPLVSHTPAPTTPVTQPASPTTVNNIAVDDDIARMEAILKQGNQGTF